MQTIQILAYGKLKEKYFRDAAAEYEKRLSRYCTFKCIELEPVQLSEKASEKEIAAALEKEGQQLLFPSIDAPQFGQNNIFDITLLHFYNFHKVNCIIS